jgi:AraC-like DNA-binding protein
MCHTAAHQHQELVARQARSLLRDPSLSIAQIATRVGYGSAAAFTLAFKRDTGHAPGSWRRLDAA